MQDSQSLNVMHIKLHLQLMKIKLNKLNYQEQVDFI